MGIAKGIMNISEKMRPVLVRIFPMGLLRNVKDWLWEQNLKKIKKRSSQKPYDPSQHEPGVNLIGNIRAEMGLGQSCRLIADELEHSGLAYSIKNFCVGGSFREEDHSWDHKIQDELPYDINLLHMQPLDLLEAYQEMDPATWDARYNIGFWLWELEDFPERWKPALDLVDEIWTPSEFVSNTMRKVTDKPVTTIPYCVTAPTDEKFDRKYFELPEDKFLFLAMYDTNSSMARKNPVGAIRAFQKAFSPDDDKVGLVLKMNNPREEDIQKLEAMVGTYKNIYYINKVMSKLEVNSLIADADVFVSLHRAEGFGLVFVEAMLNNTPCIATNWSSNIEFMNEEVACMVDYTFTVLEEDSGPYSKGVKWADANVDTAATYMKRLVEDPKYYNHLVVDGKKYIEKKLGMERISSLLKKRVQEIQHNGAAKEV